MGILSKLFGKKKMETITFSEEDYNQISSFLENLKTMDDCKLASTMIDDLGKPYPSLRNNLCDKTFNIFLEQYGRK